MFAELHSDINSPKSGFLHLTGQPYCKKSRSAKIKDGIINLFLRNNLIDRYTNKQTHRSEEKKDRKGEAREKYKATDIHRERDRQTD